MMGKHTRPFPCSTGLEKKISPLQFPTCDSVMRPEYKDKDGQDQRETLTHGNRSRHPWTLRSTCRIKFALRDLDADDRGDIDCVKWPH